MKNFIKKRKKLTYRESCKKYYITKLRNRKDGKSKRLTNVVTNKLIRTLVIWEDRKNLKGYCIQKLTFKTKDIYRTSYYGKNYRRRTMFHYDRKNSNRYAVRTWLWVSFNPLHSWRKV